MKKLSLASKKFIEQNFYEGQTYSEVDRTKLSILTQPEELHYLAIQHNWDNGVQLLQWIAESSHCSEATALYIFWTAQPQYFQKYALVEEIESKEEQELFVLIQTLHQNYSAHFYQKTSIHFNPTPFINSEEALPNFMLQPTKGMDSYVYYDKSEVESWFGEMLKNQITRCESALELFNIAYFVDRVETGNLILDHPLCDKGIALMLYWRLKTYASIWTETESLLNLIIQRILMFGIVSCISSCFPPYNSLKTFAEYSLPNREPFNTVLVVWSMKVAP